MGHIWEQREIILLQLTFIPEHYISDSQPAQVGYEDIASGPPNNCQSTKIVLQNYNIDTKNNECLIGMPWYFFH